MQIAMAEKRKSYVHWSIENFSCWDSGIHGANMSPRGFPLCLYPRGLRGEEDHAVTRFIDMYKPSRVEVCFIGSDGSLICKQEVQDPDWDKHFILLPSGPKYEDIVRKREKRDTLVLKLYRNNDDGMFYNGRTIMNSIDSCIKIPSHIFNDSQVNSGVCISTFSYNMGDEKFKFELKADLEEPWFVDSKIQFILSPSFEINTKHIFICTCISQFDKNDIKIESEENKHVFSHENDDWTFFSISRTKNIVQNEFYFILRVKFVFGGVLHVDSIPFVEYIESTIPNESNASSKTFKYETDNLNDVSLNNPLTVLSEELMSLYQDQEFSDFQLKCDSVTFPVHRVILSARSPVFKSMLSTDMREAASGCVEIKDLDPSTLAHFLVFLYIGKVKDLPWESALKLYYAADKYQVPSLKGECASVLCAEISVLNVCDILLLADQHQEDTIIPVAYDFILRNFYDVLSSKEWEKLMKSNPFLTSKTLTLFAQKKCFEKINTF